MSGDFTEPIVSNAISATSSSSSQVSPPPDLAPASSLPFFPTWLNLSAASCSPSRASSLPCSVTLDPPSSFDSPCSSFSPTIPFLISPSHARLSPPILCVVCCSHHTLPCPSCPAALCSSRCAFTHFAQSCCLGSLRHRIVESDIDILLSKAREALAIFPDT